MMLNELGIVDIFDLSGYEPYEADYARYANTEPHVIASAHKIRDVYEALSRARAYVWYLYNEKWGDFVDPSNSISLLFLKSQLLISALLLYGTTLDMSWQVIWANIQPTSLDFLLDRKYMDQYKNCDRDNILQQLNCIRSLGGVEANKADRIEAIFKAFDELPETKNLRQWYNYLKHHGAIHFEGLGINPQRLSVSIEGQSIDVLYRKSTTVEDLKKVLLDYDRSFVPYIHDLINEFIPAGYKMKKMNATDFISGLYNCVR